MPETIQKSKESIRSAKDIRNAVFRLRRRLLDPLLPHFLKKDRRRLVQMCDAVLEDISRRDRILYLQRTDGWIPYAFLISDTIAPDAAEDAYIHVLSRLRPVPEESFLRLFLPLRRASVLCRLEQYLSLDQTGQAPAQWGAWMKLLLRMETLDMEKIRKSVSQVEKILLSDPSGLYPCCTEASKAELRSAVVRHAKAKGCTEEKAASDAWEAARQAEIKEEKSIARHLLTSSKPYCGGAHLFFYSAAVLLTCFVGICLLPFGKVPAWLMTVLLFFPFYKLIREAVNLSAGHLPFLLKRKRPLLSLSLQTIPPEGKTLTVITALLTGGEQDEQLVRKLEQFFLRNRRNGGESAFCYGILADLPDSDTPESPQDVFLLERIKSQIQKLSRTWHASFCFFVRKRQYAAEEGKYMGWERKRGAVLELVRLLCHEGDQTRFAVVETYTPHDLEGIRYLCTLDADTELPYDALRTMLGVMLHPDNRPVIRDGRVIEGIGMLQPRMTLTAKASAASYLTLIMSGAGGTDPYSRFGTDTEELLYGEGSFCGKGLFSVQAYAAVLDRAFPEEAVLSHDFLEGQRLGCRMMPDVTLSDAMPAKVLSFLERESRWTRGDVQALRFCFSMHKNADGIRMKNPVPFPLRLRIADHAFDAVLPFFRVAAMLSAAYLPFSEPVRGILFLCIFSDILIHPILALLRKRTWKHWFRRFSSDILPDGQRSVAYAGTRLLFSGGEGWMQGKAVALALYRMLISKRHLLEWRTAGQAEQQHSFSTLWSRVGKLKSSLVIGALLLFSGHFVPLLFGLLLTAAPFAAGCFDRSPEAAPQEPHIPVLPVRQSQAYAGELWQYFENTVGSATSWLPPDNVQWFPCPKEIIAGRTSPTNIGLYLLACFAAYDYHLIDRSQLYCRLSQTASALASMETCHGHFYNWYQTADAKPETRYVSAVDSGNLACALVTAAGGCREAEAEDERFQALGTRLRSFADSMDFSFLYNENRRQLRIGYDADTRTFTENSYDQYASETRSALWFGIASGQLPMEAWTSLSRPVTVQNRRFALLSWSGSAFEYFMPALWFPNTRNTLSSEMLDAALSFQIRDRLCLHTDRGDFRLFGKSEGGYFDFDENGAFCYQPYGTRVLAMQEETQADALMMPYALFLMLPFAAETQKNTFDETLRGLEALGMRGRYGFYEALDSTAKRCGGTWAAVRSVMAHHAGMSLVSLANDSFDFVFQKRFCRDPRMAAAAILTDERIPADAEPQIMIP